MSAPHGTKILSDVVIGKPNTWRQGQEKFKRDLEDNYIVFKETPKGWKV